MRNARSLRCVLGVSAEDEPVILQHRPAPRGGNDDGIESTGLDLAHPHIDVVLGLAHRIVLAAEVMDERSTAAGAGCDDDFDTEPREQTLGRCVDFGAKCRLHAARQQRDPLDAMTVCLRHDLRCSRALWRRSCASTRTRASARTGTRRTHTRRRVEQPPHPLRKQRAKRSSETRKP